MDKRIVLALVNSRWLVGEAPRLELNVVPAHMTLVNPCEWHPRVMANSSGDIMTQNFLIMIPVESLNVKASAWADASPDMAKLYVDLVSAQKNKIVSPPSGSLLGGDHLRRR